MHMTLLMIENIVSSFISIDMNLFVCEHPKHIVNPYTDVELVVPCGKCHACRVRRSSSWVERLEIERSCHPYCLFVTLTYSEDFCPKVFFDSSTLMAVDNIDGVVYSYEDLGLLKLVESSNKSLKYVNKRGFVTFPCVKHIQNFIKRIRSKVYENENDITKKRVRYYFVSEYGSTNHRIHYHGLLFFESDWFANHSEDVISSAWSTDNRSTSQVSYGRTECDFVESSASSYVAQYLNCYDNLPDVYEKKPFRSVSLFSKHPAIGSLSVKSKEIQEVFDKEITSLRVYSRVERKYVDVSLPKPLEDRLFPRIKGFDGFVHSDRVALYGYLSKSEEVIYDYETFMSSLKDLGSERFGSDLTLYLKRFIDVENASASHRYFTVLNRFEHLRYDYGLSVEDLVSKIERYYVKKDYERLCNQLSFEECYEGEISDFLFLDHVFHNRLRNKSCLSDSDLLLLSSYGWDADEMSAFDFLDSKDFSKHVDFLNLVSRSKSIFERSVKNKTKKAYIRSELHTDDF